MSPAHDALVREARAIALGQTMKLAERAHLAAVLLEWDRTRALLDTYQRAAHDARDLGNDLTALIGATET